MDNYNSSRAPWYDSKDIIENVEIAEDITFIGRCAFRDCSSLYSVSIPYSVTSIEYGTFDNCSSLASVTIPSSITGLDYYAFARCTSLTSLTIPSSVTYISKYTFEGCTSLTSITVEDGNTTYDSRENCNAIINTSSNTLILGCKNTVIPSSVTSIGDYAFRGCSIASVTIPSSVTNIGYYAFNNCTSLASVIIPGSVTSIGNNAFSGCTSLASVTIENGVSSIGHSAFEYCNSLTSIIIPSSIISIGSCAFRYCPSLRSVAIENGVTSIESDAFYYCRSLTSITIPSSVTNIEIAAFAGCTSLTSIIVENGNNKYDSREGCNAIIETSSNTLVAGCARTIIPNSVISIAPYAFCGHSTLTTISIPNTVISIGKSAFYGCSSLISVAIPDGVTSIGDNTFYGCSSLASLCIPNSVVSIGEFAFERCSFTSVNIPSRVTYIGDAAFYYCHSLADVTILASTPPTISSSTFYTYGTLTLHVPSSCGDAYRAAEYWNTFTIVEDACDVPEEDAIILADAMNFENNDIQNDATIEYRRYFSDTNWQPLFIPFAPTYANWSEDFEIARLNAFYEYNEQGESKKKIEFIVINDEDAVLKPNHPYLIRAKDVGAKTIKMEHTTLYTTDANTFDNLSCSTVETNFDIKGTYRNDESILGKYYVSKGKFWLDETGYNSLPYRWFISSESKGAQYNHAGAAVRARSIEISVLGSEDATAIIDVESSPATNNNVKYSLDGRIINGEPAKGTMYIMNGRKYINKQKVMKKNYIKPETVTREIELEPILALSMEEGQGDGGGPSVRMRGTRIKYLDDLLDGED